jgi:hypothetical protein
MCDNRPWHSWTPWEKTLFECESPLLRLISKDRLGTPTVERGRKRECVRCLKEEFQLAGL